MGSVVFYRVIMICLYSVVCICMLDACGRDSKGNPQMPTSDDSTKINKCSQEIVDAYNVAAEKCSGHANEENVSMCKEQVAELIKNYPGARCSAQKYSASQQGTLTEVEIWISDERVNSVNEIAERFASACSEESIKKFNNIVTRYNSLIYSTQRGESYEKDLEETQHETWSFSSGYYLGCVAEIVTTDVEYVENEKKSLARWVYMDAKISDIGNKLYTKQYSPDTIVLSPESLLSSYYVAPESVFAIH
ncbi:MAG: hypothetical protein A3F16_05350 [Deltaproteobacteria bacterium RIFCSPHIGHO2_12_FULL_43_9]|nr:MAG: hypothetical protein A3F16_05350 [Deltaproteobacteria bacterium RIFCSPHIGHO2_12_FULL_43_9]